jgi:peptidoglycan/xylan/chitin deacetylase (PgdA/CDA1 family)
MTGAWDRLAAELDRWEPGHASLWWRDDDATAPSEALERLLGLGTQPLALAVIPAALSPDLPRALAGRPVHVLQHGFAHRNHEPPGNKKAELGGARPAPAVLAELARGRRRLAAAFGARALRVLVPPWNRIAPEVAGLLAAEGYAGLSTYGPRPARAPAGLAQANTHVDIVDWRAGRGFVGLDAAVDLAVRHLAARRRGDAEAAEPTGLLTHHLTMDQAAFDFTAELLLRTGRHPAVQWLGPDDIFALEASR